MHLPVLVAFTFINAVRADFSLDDDEDHISCPPLLPSKKTTNDLVYQCRTPDGLTTDCAQSTLPPFTVAAVRCATGYKATTRLSYRYKRCKLDGTWSDDTPLTCIQECGQARSPKRLQTEGKTVTEPRQWPWHAALYVISTAGKWEYICGGSLISQDAILTAGHCVTDFRSETPLKPEELMVILGKFWKEFNRTEESQEKRNVAKIIVHPNYSGTSFDSDIALLVLKTPVTHVVPVCFPINANTLLEEYQLQPGSIGTVLGWGMTGTEDSSELHEAHLPVISFKDCIDSYQLFFQSYGRSTNFCAGYVNGTGVCSGDSGGGMVFPSGTGTDQRWYLQGIVSVGVPDPTGKHACNPHVYALFTRVGRYAEWIGRTLSTYNTA